MKFNMSNERRQSGLAIIELMLGFIIIGAFVVGIYSGYKALSSTSLIHSETQNIQTIQGMIKDAYSTANTFSGLDNTMLTDDRAFPVQMKGVAPGTIHNSWDSKGVTVAGLPKADAIIGDAVKTTWETDEKYVITYPDVPADYCFKLVSKARPFFDEIRIGSNKNDHAAYSVPLAHKLCNENPVTTIYFIGGRQ